MSFKVQCNSCGAVIRAPEAAAGKQAPCPKCKALILLPPKEPETPAVYATPRSKVPTVHAAEPEIPTVELAVPAVREIAGQLQQLKQLHRVHPSQTSGA